MEHLERTSLGIEIRIMPIINMIRIVVTKADKGNCSLKKTGKDRQ